MTKINSRKSMSQKGKLTYILMTGPTNQADLVVNHLLTTSPTNLPVPSDDESEKVPIQDRRGQPSSADGHTGKGQGNVAVQAEGQVVSGCFETPPSKPATGTPEPLDDRLGGRLGIGGLRQSSGMMPPDSGDRDSVPSKKALRTMGPMKSAIPSSVEGKPSRVGVADAGDDGLQQALERELAEHLKEHNLRLQAELDELKAAQQGKTGSASSQSWETVDEPFNSKPAVHRSCRRSRSRTQEKQVVRLTPGGTRVPDGPPPLDDDEADLPRPPPMPNLPSFPVGGLAAAGQLAGYEMVEDVSMVKGGSRPWRPSNVDVVSPRTAKKFWVDREVQSFRNMLENRYAGNHYEGHEYWGRSSVEAASAGALVSSGKHGEVLHEDRAVAQHGEHRDQARALVQHADLCGHDRAPLQHGELRGGGRASAHGGEVCAGDRADALPADPRAEDRAMAQLYEARGDGRASALSGHREGSRASMHPEHRADGRALSSSPMLDSVQEINARDVERRQYYENLKDYYKHPLGHGVGDPSKPPEHPASPLWAPPVGGGRTIEFESESPPPGGMGQRYGAMLVWNEGGSVGNRTELPELAADATPLEFGDWAAMIGPSMRDLSAVSGRWWSSTVTMAQQYYSAWKEATPLQRVQIQPELPMMLTDVNFMRTEQRGVTLLLKAIPQDLRQSLITDRQLTSTAILYKLYVRYQPGGAGEKTLLLQQLTSTACTGTTGMSEVCDVLRKWRRHFGRAQEIQAVLPDGVLLLQALEPAVQAIMLKDSQAGFRLAQSRVQLGIDERPHHGALWSFSQCLLAEAETLALLHPGGTAAPGTPAKVKQVQVPNPSSPSPTKPTPDDTPGGGKPGKGNGASGDKPCRYFISENGCKAGKACKFLHSWEGVADKAARCWICGATSHRKAECPVRASGGKPSPSGGGSGSGGGGGSDGNGRGRGGDANKRNPYPGGGGGKSSSSGTGGGGSTTTKTSPGGNDNPGNETPAVNEMSTTGNASTGKEMSSTGMGGPTKVGANDLFLLVSSAWASHSVQGPLQKANLLKHQKSKSHRLAVKAWLKNGGCSGPSPGSAPALEEFEEFAANFGSKTSLTRKELKMAWCVAEGLKGLDQKCLANSSKVALMRDERNGRIAIRFRAVSPQLAVRSGFLGQARQSGTGADNLSAATWEVMKRACSRFVGAPDGKTQGFLKKNLFNHLQQVVVAMCADSAADEMASCEVMRTAELSLLEENKAMLPNLQHVFRDRAHASRRLTSRPWNADDKLKEVMGNMGRGPGSMARLINNSMELKRVFSNFARSSESPVHSAISSFRSAGHRFESYAKPLGRTCLFFHACVRTACHLVRARTDISAQKARAWLAWISEENLVQAAMLADAADSSLALTRALDTEDVDPAVLKSELTLYQKEIQNLFGHGKCLTSFGYTSTVCEMLNQRRGLKSLGSSSGVQQETINICLGRMRAWVKLAAAAIEAEFPHFEVSQAFDVFDLRGAKTAGETLDAHLKLLAHACKVDFDELKCEWQNWYPRAQCLFKTQSDCLIDKFSKSMGRDANKDAWRLAVEKFATRRASHPMKALREVLLQYFVCTSSTSGIEQNFSKGQAKYAKNRHHALAQHEELVLKLYIDLPSLNGEDMQEVCKLARVSWSAQYGAPRAKLRVPRADKGLKRKQVEDGGESSFLKRRRRAAAAAAAASMSQPLPNVEPQHWTERHQKEENFLLKKQRARTIQAVAEGSYPNPTAEDWASVQAAKRTFINNQNKRRRKAEKAEELDRREDRALVLSNLRGAKTFLHNVESSIPLLAAVANHGLRLTENAVEASVIICDSPGEMLSAQLQLLVALRGLSQVSPSFLTSGQGCAVKFFRAVRGKKAVLVSAAAAEKHKEFWKHFRASLPENHNWKMHRMAASAKACEDLKRKLQHFPKQGAFAVIANDEIAARPQGAKGIFTVDEFLHRVSRADLASSCWGLSK
eukprot:Skav229347  [mRNA]  locus=scaffold2596:465700:472220:+ [translate_table: standard]